jgi:prolyl oligopeptidase
MIRYHLCASGRRYMFELGSPDDPRDFHELLACSPYHQIRDGIRYPSILVISGDSDTRCDPMHARKLVARLRDANASTSSILLSYNRNRGHTGTSPLSERIDALTDQLCFVLSEMGANSLLENLES